MLNETKQCLYCEQPLDAIAEQENRKHHVACIEAYGLDYNPKSEADAKAFLARRARLMTTGPDASAASSK